MRLTILSYEKLTTLINMRELEIYLPLTHNDGRKIPASEIENIKRQLSNEFGGYTHMKSRTEGMWRYGEHEFYDEIQIVRVLHDEAKYFDIEGFKSELQTRLGQKNILIIIRTVEIA